MFYLHTSFWCLKKMKPQRNVTIKIMSFFISINYFRMLGTEWVNKRFSPKIFINISKNGKEHETCF